MKIGELHYRYTIGILVLILVCVITFYFGGKENEIVSYLGFAGTITSIILSIVALIYTFVQTVTSFTQAQKLAETSEKFDIAFRKLEETQVQMNQTQEQFDITLNNINSLGREVATTNEKLSTFAEKAMQSNLGSTAPPTNLEALYDSMLLNCSISGLIAIKLCLLQFKNPKDKNLLDIIKEYDPSEDYFQLYKYIYGFLIGFLCFGVFIFDTEPVFKIVIHNPDQLEFVFNREIERRRANTNYSSIFEGLTEKLSRLEKIYY
jgi:hypothetical protein